MRLLPLILTISFFSDAFAQADASLQRLNAAITDGQRVVLAKKVLTVEGHRDGELVKIDRLNPFDLDIDRLVFINDEKIVSLPCRKDADGCVERKRLPDGQRNHRDRLNFEVRDPQHAEELMVALRDFFRPYSK